MIVMIAMILLAIMLFINLAIKDIKISRMIILCSIITPIFVYFVNCMLLMIATYSTYFDYEDGVVKAITVAFISIMVEIGILLFFHIEGRRDELSKIWILGIIASLVLCCYSHYLITCSSPMATIVDEELTYEKLYNAVGYAINFSTAISALSVNLFILLTFKKSENTLIKDLITYE